jgi:hypothetical protein
MQISTYFNEDIMLTSNYFGWFLSTYNYFGLVMSTYNYSGLVLVNL